MYVIMLGFFQGHFLIIDIFINETLYIFSLENLCTVKEIKSKDFVN